MGKQNKLNRFADTKYTKLTRLTEADHTWLRENKGQKSAAGFLEEILREVKKQKLF